MKMINQGNPGYPPFSVAMCVYGGDNAEHFDIALESIVKQTVVPNEIVLVVDGPVPQKIHKIITRYESILSKKILLKIIRLSENMGHGNARKISIENCDNELVAIMDSDDICISDRFERQLNFIQAHPDFDIVGGNIAEFTKNPDDIISFRNVEETPEKISKDMKKRCPFNQMTVMLKKTLLQKAGGYLDWPYNEDYYLWLRMFLCKARMANLGLVLVKVRVGSDMYKRRGGWKYFNSEFKLQKYMLKNHIINFPLFFLNCAKRFAVQILMPNQVRGWIFRKFARS